MVVTTAQLHSPKPQIRFCAGSNPARGVSEIGNGEDLHKAKHISSVNHITKAIHHHESNLGVADTMTTEKEGPEMDS